ncbi:MAG TPA: thiol reductant ABC exporter subunit CydC [Aeromicrobium sp.]|nr:thiol reductant ABC exporter subunit CydC [Aeromicrobium sp.]
MGKTYSRKTRLGFGLAMGISAQLAAIGLLLTGAWLIVRAAEQPPVLYLMVAIVAVRFFGISRSVLRYVERLATHDVALADAVEERVSTYVDVDRVAPVGLGDLRSGDVVSRVVADVARLPDRLLRVRIPWWTGVAATAIVIGVIGAIDGVSAAVILVGTGLCAFGLRTIVSRTGRNRGTQVEAQGRLSAEVTAVAISAREIVAYGAQGPIRERARAATADAESAQTSGAGVSGLGAALVMLVTGAMVSVLAASSAGIDPVVIGVILLAPIALAEPMDGWAEAERFRPLVEAAVERLSALGSLSSPVSDPASPTDLPSNYDLAVTDLVAGWDGQPTTRPVSFNLAQGGKIALTGPSGSGKSTMAYTLLRLIEPITGEMLLGGTSTGDLTAADVRTRIGYLGQDDMVFDTTIRENLRIADPQANDGTLHNALRLAGLAALTESLPKGLDTEVGERGGRLSGGERQRLCLARLLLGDHRILVLDEPTEHLDPPTAEALMDDVLALADQSGRSLIVISHAPMVLARFEEVLTLAPDSIRLAGEHH